MTERSAFHEVPGQRSGGLSADAAREAVLGSELDTARRGTLGLAQAETRTPIRTQTVRLDQNRLFVIQSALTSWWSAPLYRSERQR